MKCKVNRGKCDSGVSVTVANNSVNTPHFFNCHLTDNAGTVMLPNSFTVAHVTIAVLSTDAILKQSNNTRQ